MPHDVKLLRRVYALFNGREIESALAAMHPDVVWANGMEGGHVHGRDEVRSYWKRQWATIDPHVEPVEISPRARELKCLSTKFRRAGGLSSLVSVLGPALKP
jgi:SnoaL-like domain